MSPLHTCVMNLQRPTSCSQSRCTRENRCRGSCPSPEPRWLASEKNLTDRGDILSDAVAVTGIARMKFRCADWAILVRVREVFLQGCQCKRIARITSLRLNTERRDCCRWSIHKSRNREQHVLSILRKSPTCWSAKCIELEHEQWADVGHRHFAFLRCPVEVVPFHLHHSPAGQRSIYSWNHTGDHIVHQIG